MGKSRGRHRTTIAKKNAVPLAGAAGIIAAAGAAVVGLTPTLAASPELMASNAYYVPGTKIGQVRTPAENQTFAQAMLDATGHGGLTYHEIDYPGGFWPLSGLSSPTYNQSVALGLDELTGKPAATDTIIGYSQGAVVATEYKRLHPNTGVTYVLVENPNKPNGGILERFNGLTIPILDVSFNGATPTTGGATVDISRQYDGWSDFPTYPLNPLATANAILGIYYLHGDTQDLGADALAGIDVNDPNQYQVHGDTTYYVIPTERLPLLMPFSGIVPDPILDALDPPLRVLVELGYDRTDYGMPTPAGIVPIVNPITVAQKLANATVEGVQAGLADSGATTTSIEAAKVPQTPALKPPVDLDILNAFPKPDVPKRVTPKPRLNVSPLSQLGILKPTTPIKAAGSVKIDSSGKAFQSALKSLAPKNFSPKNFAPKDFAPKKDGKVKNPPANAPTE